MNILYQAVIGGMTGGLMVASTILLVAIYQNHRAKKTASEVINAYKEAKAARSESRINNIMNNDIRSERAN